jgi:secretion/DNA translocation related TadE-like protein
MTVTTGGASAVRRGAVCWQGAVSRREGTQRKAASQRGAGTLLVSVAMVVVLVVAAVALLAVSYAGAQREAVDAADLTALAGAAGYARGQDACGVAADIAKANRVVLAKCDVSGDSMDFVVAVTVQRDLDWPLALPGLGLPAVVQGASQAGRLSPT